MKFFSINFFSVKKIKIQDDTKSLEWLSSKKKSASSFSEKGNFTYFQNITCHNMEQTLFDDSKGYNVISLRL